MGLAHGGVASSGFCFARSRVEQRIRGVDTTVVGWWKGTNDGGGQPSVLGRAARHRIDVTIDPLMLVFALRFELQVLVEGSKDQMRRRGHVLSKECIPSGLK